jgi:restriction system protein
MPKPGSTYIDFLLKQTKGKSVVETENLSLKEWLDLILKQKPKDKLFIDYMFPTDSHRDEYLETVSEIGYAEVKNLLRNFLWLPGSFAEDAFKLEVISKRLKNGTQSKPLKEIERRIILWAKSKGKFPVWDGTQWVLDLLPDSPRECIQVLWAYFSLYAAIIPEGRMYGLIDAMDVVRKRFILCSYPKNLYHSISNRELEILVAALYNKMEYEVELTPPKRDGGRDVIASSKVIGRLEHVLIEVKHHKKPIGVKIVRELLGVVTSEKSNKGVIVCTSKFTRGAENLCASNPRIELICGRVFNQLMNEYFGSNWNSKIYQIISAIQSEVSEKA